MTATYGCWQVSPKLLPFFLSDLFRRLSLTALVFDDCMENDTWVMWDRHRTGESKGGFDLRNPKPETRNSNPESRNRQRKLVSGDETRNPKPETDSESITIYLYTNHITYFLRNTLLTGSVELVLLSQSIKCLYCHPKSINSNQV